MFQDLPLILEIADLPMPLTLIFAISSELKANIVVDNMQFHRSKRMFYYILCNGSVFVVSGLLHRKNVG